MSTFKVGKITFGEADYPYLFGSFLIMIGIFMLVFFSLKSGMPDGEASTSIDSTPTKPASGRKTKAKKSPEVLGQVFTPEGRRSARLKGKTPRK